MDISLSPDQIAFRDTARTWLSHNVPPDLAERVHSGRRLSREDMQGWFRTLGRQGYLTGSWPVEFGGLGWTAVEKYLFEEEAARAGAPRVLSFGPVMVAPVIMKFGNAAQHERFLPGIRSGEVWWSQGYSEPGAGSDLASLKTRAERQGDHYVVNGQKTWATLAQHGDWIFCLVRTSADGKPQNGISFLLVDMRSPGITIRPIRLLDGECEVNEIFFDDVRVPVENLIGEENKGWTYAKYQLGHERTSIANANRAKQALKRLKTIARLEGLEEDVRFRDEIARLEIEIVALEMLVLRVLTSAGQAPMEIAALLKVRGSEIQQRLTELMMLAAGPSSLPYVHEAIEAGWQGMFFGPDHARSAAADYFNMRKSTIYGGTNEVQRNIVAQMLLG